MSTIFISYSRKDTDIADRICRVLDKHAIPYFIDRTNLVHGSRFTEDIALAIEECRLILFLASKNSYDSQYTIKEINYGINKHKNILPYIIDDSQLPRNLSFLLSDLSWAFMNQHPIEPDLVNSIKKLIAVEDESSAEEYEDRALDEYFKENWTEAMTFFKKAAALGSIEARHNIGIMYNNGDGVPQDYDEAIRNFEMSAHSGFEDSMIKLGEIYRYKKGDIPKSLEWFGKAADRGNGEGCFGVGYIYYCEDEFTDLKKARIWFERALKLGYEPAAHPLDILNRNGY